MGLSQRLLRLPRPQRFFYTMTLSTGASLITLSLLLNKVSGFFGLLALFTGYHLSPLQLSMYIYSLIILVLVAYLAPSIRTGAPLPNLALAWLYVVDSLVNAAYTALFGLTWFLVLAQHNANGPTSSAGPGAGMMDDTAGFTSPEFNVSHVEITPIRAGEASLSSTPAASPAGTSASGESVGHLAHTVLGPESMNSIGVITTLWTIRLYFCLVMLAYARGVVRAHIVRTAAKNSNVSFCMASPDKGLAENPFAVGRPEGRGWRGKLGRVMVGVGKRYWLGSDEEGDGILLAGAGRKYRRSEEGGEELLTSSKVEWESGPAERERRRRSGTGPPAVPVQLQLGQGGPQGKGLSVPMQDLR